MNRHRGAHFRQVVITSERALNGKETQLRWRLPKPSRLGRLAGTQHNDIWPRRSTLSSLRTMIARRLGPHLHMPTWIIYAASPHDSDIPARHAAVDTFVVERTSSFSHAGETFPRLPDPPHSCQRFPGHVRAHGSSTATPRSFSPAQRATLPVPTQWGISSSGQSWLRNRARAAYEGRQAGSGKRRTWRRRC
ncbi:hypothetical protein B0H11DRAFT_1035063 [Mycena galericulata]|nr:hypothetical protein B0H11DRAFT_1035063 [Mycena galericulata]